MNLYDKISDRKIVKLLNANEENEVTNAYFIQIRKEIEFKKFISDINLKEYKKLVKEETEKEIIDLEEKTDKNTKYGE